MSSDDNVANDSGLPDGRVTLRFDLTEREELRVWFVEILDYDRCRLDFAPGAALTFVADGLPAGRGEVTAYDPPRHR